MVIKSLQTRCFSFTIVKKSFIFNYFLRCPNFRNIKSKRRREYITPSLNLHFHIILITFREKYEYPVSLLF